MLGLGDGKRRVGGDKVRYERSISHLSQLERHTNRNSTKIAVHSLAYGPMPFKDKCKHKFVIFALSQVGREMISNSDDSVLRQDMPAALAKVEGAARLLVEASTISRSDPTSKVARTKLIEGSRRVFHVPEFLGLSYNPVRVPGGFCKARPTSCSFSTNPRCARLLWNAKRCSTI